ncbi:MAG: secondary thiamine-phosphate synthase enzyme YjbQ [Alphaproteobacteria bacterium]
MRQVSHQLSIETTGRGLYEVTDAVAAWLAGKAMGEGLLTVFIRHTSASLLIQEIADPDVLRDLDTAFVRLAPEDPNAYRHRSEGPDDMPAHIRAALTQTHLATPVFGGRMALGTWQGIYVFEHRAAPHSRRLALHLLGD